MDRSALGHERERWKPAHSALSWIEECDEMQRVADSSAQDAEAAVSAAMRPKTSAAARPLAYPPVEMPPASAPAA